MKNQVTYILSNINKALAFEWITENLNKDTFELSFILLNPAESELETYLLKHHIPVFRIRYRGKKDFIKAFFKIRKLLKKLKTKVVHTHLFDASMVGLLAAKSVGVKKRVFTRHHASIHHIYFPRAVRYDKFINKIATHIVAISKNIQDILVEKENAKPEKISIVHHGFKLEDFELQNIAQERIDKLAEKYQSKNKYPVIGVIARQTHWKGIQFIIPAFAKILEKYPKAHLLLANATGDYKPAIDKLLMRLPENSFTEIVFENDLFALYQLFDVYVHTPIDEHSEAFGQTYIEALAAKIPSIFTLSGVATEFIDDEKNAMLVPFQDSEAIYENICQLLENTTLQNKLKVTGREAVSKMFSLEQMIEKLEKLYIG